MNHNYEAVFWADTFADILAFVFSTYGFSDKSLQEAKGCSDSTVRKWLSGKRLPRLDNKEDLFNYLREQIPLKDTSDKALLVKEYIEAHLAEKNLSIVRHLNFTCGTDTAAFIVGILQLCLNNSKEKHNHNAESSGNSDSTLQDGKKTKAVVFDFDGTLTISNLNRTTWENLWCSLGYDVNECRYLHSLFNDKQIDHPTWCKLTEDKFKEKICIGQQLNHLQTTYPYSQVQSRFSKSFRRTTSRFILFQAQSYM